MEQEKKNCPYCGEEILAIAKKCKHCGEWLNNVETQKEEKPMVPCPICGEMIEEDISQCPYCHESIIKEPFHELIKGNNPEVEKNKTRSFFDYYFVEPFIKHYFKFRGRINRKHFWISMLLWFTINLFFIFLIFIMSELQQAYSAATIGIVIWVGWIFLSIIPVWAAVLRRMRDADSELGLWGWWFYIIPVPYMIMTIATNRYTLFCIVPFIILLWWLLKPSDNIMRDDGLAPDEEPKVEFLKSDKIAVRVIILIVLGVFLSATFDNQTKNASPIENQTKIKEQVTDSNNPQDIKIAYLALLSQYAQEVEDGGYGYTCTYFLFDITSDNIPELWIKFGSCEADRTLSVYTYDDGIKTIDEGEEGNASHSVYHKGKDYILKVSGHMGYATWTKITYKEGQLVYEYVFEEDINESGQDGYTEPKEAFIEEYSVNDTSFVSSTFGK